LTLKFLEGLIKNIDVIADAELEKIVNFENNCSILKIKIVVC